MELNTKVNGTMQEKEMVKECKFGQMGRFMKATGKMEKRMERVD